MTTFFGGPGFGGGATQPPTREMKALTAIDSRTKPFTNKDFVRNMQWLNNSVDTLSVYTQKLQKGVDAANQNALEQIQGIIADLIVIFAGGTPTGIDLGDLKYIFQALGALLGVNPDTVFPLNLVEAVGNLFDQFIVPLPQFTDIIFDAMVAWMAVLGFSDEAQGAVSEFNDAIADFYNAWSDVTSNLIPALNRILKELGWGSGWLSLEWLKEIVNDLRNRIDNILARPKELLFNLLNTLIVTLFKGLTWIVNFFNPRNLLGALGLQTIGPQLAPPISDQTTIWEVGSNPNTQWIWDSVEIAPGSNGSFRTTGNAFGKRILTQGTEICTPGETFMFSGWLKWQGVPTHTPIGDFANQFGPCIVWYAGLNEISQTNIDAPDNRGVDGGWFQVGRNVVVPNNVDGFKIGYRCGAQISVGTVWAGELSCAKLEVGQIDVIGSLYDATIGRFLKAIGAFDLPTYQDWINIWNNAGAMAQNAWNAVSEFVNNFAEKVREVVTSLPVIGPIIDTTITNVQNRFNQLIGLIPIGNLTNATPNLFWSPNFATPESIDGLGDWIWEAGGRGPKPDGFVYTIANGSAKALVSNPIWVVALQEINVEIFVTWEGLVYGGADPPFELGYIPCTSGTGEIGIASDLIEIDVIQRLSVPPLSLPTDRTDWNNAYKLEVKFYVPEGIDAVKFVLSLNPSATAGKICFDDASAKRAAQTLPQQWITGLTAALDNIRKFIQDVVDGIWEWATGLPIVGATIGQLKDGLDTFKSNVNGAIQSARQFAENLYNEIIDALVNGFKYTTGIVGAGIEELRTAAKHIAAEAVSGIQGFLDIGTTMQQLWDIMQSAIRIDIPGLASGAALSQVGQSLQDLAQNVNVNIQILRATRASLGLPIVTPDSWEGGGLGSNVVVLPTEWDYIDLVAVGGGGGGGALFGLFDGQGGGPGYFAWITLIRDGRNLPLPPAHPVKFLEGTDLSRVTSYAYIHQNAVTVTGFLGAGGTGGSGLAGLPGSDGQSSFWDYTAPNGLQTRALTAGPGRHGGSALGGTNWQVPGASPGAHGIGPGTLEYRNRLYFGGGNVVRGNGQTPGAYPGGGGGAGILRIIPDFGTWGGNGGHGKLWMYAYVKEANW